MLAVSMSGEKLKPLIIFQAQAANGKVSKDTESYDVRANYTVASKGFCDTTTMLCWIDKCLKPFLEARGGGTGKAPSILMLDNFKAHLTKPVKDALSKLGCFHIPLPANTTSVTQILDVGVNAPFKANYKAAYLNWMANQENRLKAKVSRQLCAKWMSDSWENVTFETIKNTSRKIFEDVFQMG